MIKVVFRRRSRDQDEIRATKINGSTIIFRYYGTPENQAIMRFWNNNQGLLFLIRILDHVCTDGIDIHVHVYIYDVRDH